MKFEVREMNEAYLAGWPAAYATTEPSSGIWATTDAGVPIRYLGRDGGEPEDQRLDRRWRWVKDALEWAHAEGGLDAEARVRALESQIRAIVRELKAANQASYAEAIEREAFGGGP